MKSYLDNLKIENNTAEGDCQLDENEANPIGIGLYEQICKWAIDVGTLSGIFVLAFATTQWNIMGQTLNVDPLGFHNLHKSQHDSKFIQYDSKKMDKKGERVTPKHCYGTPTEPNICIFLALDFYVSINQNLFSQKSDKILWGVD
jgi:hypothetical protein